MMVIQNRGHCIETEAIELELVQEVGQVGEEEAENLIFGVVEKHGIPLGVPALFSTMTVLVISAIKL